MKKVILIMLLSLSVNAFAIRALDQKNYTFKVNPSKLSNKLHYSVNYFSPSQFNSTNLINFDVEDYASESNTEIVFVKAAFIVDRPIDEITEDKFLNIEGIKRIYRANKVKQTGSNSFKASVGKIAFTMEFDLNIHLYSGMENFENEVDTLIDLSDSYERDIPRGEKYQILDQSNFSHVFGGTKTVNKFIPYGDETLVVSYTIGRLQLSQLKKLDKIPFVNARKMIKGELKDSMIQTYKEMN